MLKPVRRTGAGLAGGGGGGGCADCGCDTIQGTKQIYFSEY